MPVSNVQMVLGKNNMAVLITLVIILKVIYLLSTSESEADPMEVYYFLPLIPNPLHKKTIKEYLLKPINMYIYKLIKRNFINKKKGGNINLKKKTEK